MEEEEETDQRCFWSLLKINERKEKGEDRGWRRRRKAET
jgi:hypothetical protein